jgi:hypothetical protein
MSRREMPQSNRLSEPSFDRDFFNYSSSILLEGADAPRMQAARPARNSKSSPNMTPILAPLRHSAPCTPEPGHTEGLTELRPCRATLAPLSPLVSCAPPSPLSKSHDSLPIPSRQNRYVSIVALRKSLFLRVASGSSQSCFCAGSKLG